MSTTAPKSGPHDVKVDWLLSGTEMSVSFTKLSVVEANSVNISYYISYSTSPLIKRQSEVKRVAVREKDNATVIGGVDPSLDYQVIVEATNSHGTKSSSPYILTAGVFVLSKNSVLLTMSLKSSNTWIVHFLQNLFF